MTRDVETETITCSDCGKDCSLHYYMCDETEGEWCPKCFKKTPCGKGKHGEGCETGVFSDGH